MIVSGILSHSQRGGKLWPIPVAVHLLQTGADRAQFPPMNAAGVTRSHDELRAVRSETHPRGMVTLGLFEFGHSPSGGDLLKINHARRHFHGHQLSVRSE